MARPKEFDTTAVLDRAVEVFWTQGYEATSLPDLLGAMQISRQSCYDTFGNKHALFIRALERFVDTKAAQTLAPLETADAGFTQIAQLLRGMAEQLASDAGCRACLVANSAMELAPDDPEVAAIVRAMHARSQAALANAVGNAQTVGDIHSRRPPRQLARYLRATTQGMLVLAKGGASRAELRDIAEVTLDSLTVE